MSLVPSAGVRRKVFVAGGVALLAFGATVARPVSAQAASAPYERQLLRLSELLGALHYLRTLCGAADAAAWRDRMTALMDGESADDAERERFAGAFNRGYRTFQQSYRSCTPSARETVRAYLDEGGQIARDVGARYGN